MPVRKRGLSLALAAPASAAPDRDLVLMLTADEESTGASGIMLSTTHRDLIAADFALNTDAGGVIEGPDA